MLPERLHFNSDDLNANRAGELSARQTRRYARIRQGRKGALTGVTVLAAGSLAGTLMIDNALLALGFGSMALMTGMLGVVDWFVQHRADQTPQVVSVQGRVRHVDKRDSVYPGVNDRIGVRVGDVFFALPPDRVAAFTEGELVICYYLTPGRILLSYEPALRD